MNARLAPRGRWLLVAALLLSTSLLYGWSSHAQADSADIVIELSPDRGVPGAPLEVTVRNAPPGAAVETFLAGTHFTAERVDDRGVATFVVVIPEASTIGDEELVATVQLADGAVGSARRTVRIDAVEPWLDPTSSTGMLAVAGVAALLLVGSAGVIAIHRRRAREMAWTRDVR
jgi:hypothetical protein